MRKLDDLRSLSYEPVPRTTQPVLRAPVNIPATVTPVKKTPAVPSPEFRTMANINTTKTAAPPLSTQLPAMRTTAAPGTTATPSLPAFNLPALSGNQFVAQPTGGATGPSASTVVGQIGQNFKYQPGQTPTAAVNQMLQQFRYQPGATPASVAQQLAQQLGTDPQGLPIEIVQQIQAAFQGPSLDSAANTTLGNLDSILNREGSFVANARRRGLEGANARGLMNSSLAQGAAERSAIEASQPILAEIMGLNSQREGQDFAARQNAINQAFGLTSDREQRAFDRDTQTISNAFGLTQQDRDAVIQQARDAFGAAMQLTGQDREAALAQARDKFAAAMQLTGQREQNAFAGQQNQLDRVQGVNNALLAGQLDQRRALLGSQLGREEAILDTKLRQALQNDAAKQQDWLASNAFSREFNGALSMMPITSAFDLNSRIQQFAMENPEIYTPEVISGMSNFFNRNMLSMLQQYFPDMVGG